MSQTPTVNIHELLDRIRIGYNSDNPIFIHGPPGIGKSDTTKQVARTIAEEKGLEFVEWPDITVEEYRENAGDLFLFVDQRLAQSDATDSKGLPDLNESSDFTEWKPPAWVHALTPDDDLPEEDIQSVVFCDELNNAPQLVQKAYYRLILDREAGSDQRLSENVYLLAAGNREEDKANVNPMPTPLRNRFGHVELEPPKGGKPNNDESDPTGLWTEWAVENEISTDIVGFIGSNLGVGELYKFDPDKREAMAFATPRTWEMSSKAIKSMENPTITQKVEGVEMFVGEGTAATFRGFLETKADLDLEKYMNDPSTVREIGDMKVDVKHALVTAIAEEFRQDPTMETLSMVMEVAYHIPDTEFGAYLLSVCRSYHPDEFQQMAPEIERFGEIAEEFIHFMDLS